MLMNDLAQDFLKKYVERKLRPSTARGYRVNLERHVLPYFGDRTLESLTVDDLDVLTDRLQELQLSNRSIVYVHATVRKMLNYAIRRGYMNFNPYCRFDMPRVEKYRYRVLTEEEIYRMLDVVRGTFLEVPIVLALCYGLRRGECLGVMPQLDVDPQSNILHVQRTRAIENKKEVITPCKTDDSNRYILLRPEHTQLLLARSEYACELTPNQLEHHYKKMLQRHNFPQIRFHDLRHSYATFMLSKGVDLKIISDVLGHSDIAITADTYLHPDVSVQQKCLQFLK